MTAIRPLMGAFFAGALIRGQLPQPSQFFGTAFWIGFTLETIAAEWWIRKTRAAIRGREFLAAG